MALQSVINYDTAGNFTFTAADLEFVGALVRHIDKRPADATLYASYLSSINANWGDGALTGTPFGGAAVVDGKLDLTGGTVQYVDYNANIPPGDEQTAALRLVFTPNYSGNPAANRTLFSVSKAAGDDDNLVFLRHTTAGQLFLIIKDNVGGDIVSVTLGVWNPTAGVDYEFELNTDVTAGATRLFVDGTQFGATQVGTGTRDSGTRLFRIGSNSGGTDTSDFSIKDLIAFSTVQHVTDYTPGAAISPTVYALETAITENGGQLMDGFEGLTETTASLPSGTSAAYILVVDGQDKYWDGAAWVNSDGTAAQASTLADVNTNKAALDLTSGATVKLKTVLTSDGSTLASLTTHTVDYNFSATVSALPNTCIVYGEEILPEQDALLGIMRVTLADGFYHTSGHYVGTQVIDIPITKVGDRGYWEIALTETATDGKTYIFEKIYPRDDGGEGVDTFAGVTVPDQATANLQAIA